MDTTFCTKCVPRELTRRGWTVDRVCAVARTDTILLYLIRGYNRHDFLYKVRAT